MPMRSAALVLPLPSLPRRPWFRSALLAAPLLASLTAVTPAHALEVYAPIGIPGLGLGVAWPLGDRLGLRVDHMSLGRRAKDTTENGIAYRGQYEVNRTALLVDLFPFAGRFRVTAGVTQNSFEIALDASGAGGSLTIGDRTYATTAADGLEVAVRFPKTRPYLGVGWGHQAGSGWRFAADLGATLGKATLTGQARGALADQPDIQQNIDRELAELRDGVGKVRAIPQISVSVGYSF